MGARVDGQQHAVQNRNHDWGGGFSIVIGKIWSPLKTFF